MAVIFLSLQVAGMLIAVDFILPTARGALILPAALGAFDAADEPEPTNH